MPRRQPARSEQALTAAPGIRQTGAVVVAVIMLFISCWMLFGIVGQVITGAQLEQQRAEAQAEVSKLKAENASLQGDVDYAESPAYAEKVARDELILARDGDTVILPTYPDVTATAVLPTPAPLPNPTAQPNWRGWQQALFP
jgi:cell division protein FtsB